MEKSFVIGIAGGSASGKSTFADALARALQDRTVLVFHMDAYFKPAEQLPRAEAPITGRTYVDHNHPLTMDLPGLARDLAHAVAENRHQVILVEGLLALWEKSICDQLDLKLFVECRPDERIVRRLKRNMQWGLTFDEISDVYLDLVRYRHDEYVEPSKWRADLILNGSNPSDKTLAMLVGYVEGMLEA